MAVYKVSFVVTGSDHPGAIANMSRPPEVGERVKLGDRVFRVTEVLNLIPPRGEFHYIHVTCSPAEDEKPKRKSNKQSSG